MESFSRFFRPRYVAINRADSFDGSDVSPTPVFCQNCDEKLQSRESRSCVAPTIVWIVTTIFLLFALCVTVIFEIFHPKSGLRSSSTQGFRTEFGTAKSEISFREVAFTGNLNFFENGTSYLEEDPQSKQYVGKPSDDIDRNWKHLLQHRYFYMTEAEVLDTWGPSGVEEYFYHLSPENERKYIGGLDTLHTLHCVEQLRQTLDRDHYPKAKKQGSLHLYHCIDHIRQWIMCTGDFTPIPTRRHPSPESKDASYVDTDQVHTCRNFDALWDWVQTREIVHSF